MSKKVSWTEPVLNFLLDFGVYGMCFAGVFMSRYLPEFAGKQHISIGWSIGEVIISAMVSFMVMFGLDSDGDHAEEEHRKAAKEAKRRNWHRRAAYALAMGFMWQQLIGII